MTVRDDQIKAMANSNRLEILRLLIDPSQHFADQESADPVAFGVCIQLVAERLGIAQPTTSRHVEILKRAGFLKIRRFQKWSYCSRDEAALSEYLRWLSQDLNIHELSPEQG